MLQKRCQMKLSKAMKRMLYDLFIGQTIACASLQDSKVFDCLFCPYYYFKGKHLPYTRATAQALLDRGLIVLIHVAKDTDAAWFDLTEEGRCVAEGLNV